MRRVGTVLCITMLILFSISQLGLSRSETGTITKFSDQTSEKNITFPLGGGTDLSPNFEIPKKATITNATFDVSVKYSPTNEYPNKPTIDVG
ncbi:MAG: hypothetical protein KAJ51_12890, partial [Thermoplasmata archaeon]|nr:hypothetical protein [Thermoplasmata archaeon]